MNYIHVIKGKEIYMKKKLVLMTSALMAMSLLAGCNKHTHEWGEVVYSWSQDNKTCTAERVCKGDESHKETETVDTTYEVVDPAKCEKDGKGRYTADFTTNEAFIDQTKDIVLSAIGHEWGTPAYTWSDDYSSCTATRVCKNDSNHIESETADSAYTELMPATCDEDGSAVYDAAFENEAFEVQSHEVTLPATGHNLTAHDSHAETCTEAGNCAYWSCERCGKFFSDEEGKDELKKDGWIIPAHAHTLIHNDAKAATCYVPGNIEYWVCTECFQYFSDEACTHPIKQEDVRTPAHHTLTHHEAKNATRLEDGNIEYWSCDVCGKYFSDEEGKNEIDAESIIIPALGTNKSYFNGTYWVNENNNYQLYLSYKYFTNNEILCNYFFNDFDYNDETKVLSFIVTRFESYGGYSSPYKVGDKISFTYNAKKDVLMFGTAELSKQ